MSEQNIKKLQEQFNRIQELEQRQLDLQQEVAIRTQCIENQNLIIKQYEQKILNQVSEIVDKRFNDNEKQYILNRIYKDFTGSVNDNSEQKEKWNIKFLQDMILHFMPDDEQCQIQLEKLLYYNNL